VRSTALETAALVAGADRGIRSLAAKLAPAPLYELGLSAGLEYLVEEMEKSFGLGVALSDDGLGKRLSQRTRSVVYRVVRDLLINVVRHSEADTASVQSRRVGDQLLVTVVDTGVGLDSPGEAAISGAVGLAGVRERLSCIGATFDLESSRANGTSATIAIPLAAGGLETARSQEPA